VRRAARGAVQRAGAHARTCRHRQRQHARVLVRVTLSPCTHTPRRGVPPCDRWMTRPRVQQSSWCTS
jgi:pyrimidine deaminase RibD-like protein